MYKRIKYDGEWYRSLSNESWYDVYFVVWAEKESDKTRHMLILGEVLPGGYVEDSNVQEVQTMLPTTESYTASS